MEQREMLIELVVDGNIDADESGANSRLDRCEKVADWLLANGVVVLPCRCKECVWWKYNGADDALIPPTCYGDDGKHFCAYGERKGGDDNA